MQLWLFDFVQPCIACMILCIASWCLPARSCVRIVTHMQRSTWLVPPLAQDQASKDTRSAARSGKPDDGDAAPLGPLLSRLPARARGALLTAVWALGTIGVSSTSYIATRTSGNLADCATEHGIQTIITARPARLPHARGCGGCKHRSLACVASAACSCAHQLCLGLEVLCLRLRTDCHWLSRPLKSAGSCPAALLHSGGCSALVLSCSWAGCRSQCHPPGLLLSLFRTRSCSSSASITRTPRRRFAACPVSRALTRRLASRRAQSRWRAGPTTTCC